MEKHPALDVDHGFFATRQLDSVVEFRFKENIFRHATNLTNRDLLQSYFDGIASRKEIKVIVINSAEAHTGCDEYVNFFRLFRDGWERNDIRRLCNVINQIILTIMELNKLVIHVNSGKVISLFMNIGLACDYRVVADDTVFQNPYLDLGLLSKGGGAFFLTRLLGPSRAYEVLLLNREITAEKALSLGIVDRVVPAAELESTALELARRFADNPGRSLSGVKRLVQFSMRDIRDYLDYENQEIFRIVDSPDFGSQVGCEGG